VVKKETTIPGSGECGKNLSQHGKGCVRGSAAKVYRRVGLWGSDPGKARGRGWRKKCDQRRKVPQKRVKEGRSGGHGAGPREERREKKSQEMGVKKNLGKRKREGRRHRGGLRPGTRLQFSWERASVVQVVKKRGTPKRGLCRNTESRDTPARNTETMGTRKMYEK